MTPYRVCILCCVALSACNVSAQDPIYPTASDLVQVVRNYDKPLADRVMALIQLQQLGPAAGVALPLLNDLVADTQSHENPHSFTLAYQAVKCLKQVGKPGIPGLRTALKSKKLRLDAAKCLGTFGRDADAAPEILACIAEDPVACSAMFEDLDKIGPDPKFLNPVAMKVLRTYADGHKTWAQAARRAANSLAKLGPAALDAAPALIAVLRFQGRDTGPTKSACEALGAIGPGAEVAVPFLASYCHRPPKDLAQAAEAAIAKIRR